MLPTSLRNSNQYDYHSDLEYHKEVMGKQRKGVKEKHSLAKVDCLMNKEVIK